MIFTSYLQNLNVHNNKMAEKAMFESIKSGTSLLKEKTFSEKAEQRAVITFCTGIGKNSYKHSHISARVDKNMSRSSLFKWYKMFSDGRNM